jgi:hypothetical protein
MYISILICKGTDQRVAHGEMHLVIGRSRSLWVFAPSSFSSLEGVLTLRRETDDEMPTNMHAHDVA